MPESYLFFELIYFIKLNLLKTNRLKQKKG